MLVIASMPVQATDRDCGTCEAIGDYQGGPQWTLAGKYNDEDYDGPYEEWWDDYDNLNFTLVLNITNHCGLTTDFLWTVQLDAESWNWQSGPTPYCFAILGGDNSPVYDTEEFGHWGEPCEDTVFVSGLAHGNTNETTLTIQVYNTFYFSFVDIFVMCQPFRNGFPVSNIPATQFEWMGFR